VTASVTAEQRFSARHPCPVCGRGSGLARGQAIRCYGFLSTDGRYAHCTREEYAGGLDQEDGGTYAHRLDGPCRCGRTHGDPPPAGKVRQNGRARRVVGEKRHVLHDHDGRPLFVHCREYFDDGDKQIWWEQPDGTRGLGGAKVVDLPLYGVHELAGPGGFPSEVVVVEGEPARDALAGLGIPAVATVCGAKTTPSAAQWRPLLGVKTVYLWPDHDADGQRHLAKNLAMLRGLGHPDVRVVAWPDAPPKGDAADFVGSGGTAADLASLMERARPAEGFTDSLNAETSSQRAVVPLTGFPPAVRDYCRAAAAAIGCPVEFVALPLLCGIGTAIGNRVAFAIKPGLTAPAILFAAGIGHPGTGKTPAAEAGLVGLRRRQDASADDYQRRLDRYEALAKKDRDAATPPVMDRIMVSDVTIEALAKDAARSRGLLTYPGELTGWLHALSRYKQNGGSDRPQWLQLWSGQAIDQARLSRGPVYAKRPHIALYGEVQPDRVDLITKEAGNDGLLDRFLVAWPDAEPLPMSDRPMPDPKPIVDLIDTLLKIDAAPNGGAWIVKPTREAFGRYREWHDDENLQAIKDGMGAGRGWAAKAPQHVQRLALVLHLLNNPMHGAETDLSVETIDEAVSLVEYFRRQQAQLIAVLQAGVVATPKSVPLAQRVLRLLRRKARWIATDELVAGIRTATMDDLRPVLDDLIAAGSVEEREVKTATKPRREWRAVPVPPENDSVNSVLSKNPSNDAEDGDTGEPPSSEFTESGNSVNSDSVNPFEAENLASDQEKSENTEFTESKTASKARTTPDANPVRAEPAPWTTCLDCGALLTPGRSFYCLTCQPVVGTGVPPERPTERTEGD
jgi:hypothetical protein